MKKYFIILLISFISLSGNLVGENVTAYVTYASFNVPAQKPYFETYLSVIGNSLSYIKNANGKFQGAIDISVSFVQSGTIKSAQKYTLNSPELDDTVKERPNFLDQQRYELENGAYEMELSITDKNKPGAKPFTTKVSVKINFPDDRVMLSDIQLLESYTKSVNPGVLTKSGYDLVPYVSTFYPENISKIKFYAEIYNAKKILGDGQRMIISYYLETYETKTQLSEFAGFSKQAANDVNILLAEFNAEKLPTGNYNLVIQVRDKENKIQADQICFVQRKAKQVALSEADLKTIDVSKTFVSYYKNIDTLTDYMRCLRPISSSSEIEFAENQLKEKKLELIQQFFYNFWRSRNEKQPEITWLEYYKEVMKVNEQFATYGMKGYDTDRGRIYLQYGTPDARDQYPLEPSAYPYEIWQYNQLTDRSQALTNPNNKQSNKRFVFYNPDKVTNKYWLLHSDAKGERYNNRWQIDIHKRDTNSPNLDNEKVRDHFGGQSTDGFMNPK